MEILLTGGTGFLGGYILRKLIDNNYKVVLLKRTTSDASLLEDVIDKCATYNIDEMAIEEILSQHNIQLVLHVATSYGRKGEKVSQIINSNLILPVSILELCDKYGINAFINTDTFFTVDTEYPDNLNSYVFSKKHFLDYAKNIVNNGDVKLINVKVEHLYGKFDDPLKFIPYTITKFIHNEKYLDLTAGEQKRDFIYIDDAVSAYIKLIENYHKLEDKITFFELGTGNAIPISELVKMINKLCNSSTKIRFGALPYRKNEIMCSKANIECFKKLGWYPKIDLAEGLKEVIQFEKKRQGISFE